MLVSAWVERFFFYPDNARYTTPAQFGLQAEDVWIAAADGSKLHAWFLPAVSVMARPREPFYTCMATRPTSAITCRWWRGCHRAASTC